MNLENQEIHIEEVSSSPQTLSDLISQDRIKRVLGVTILAAQRTGRPLPHTLLYGPAGHGKTTIARILAREMGRPLTIIMGPSISKPDDLLKRFADISHNSVIFIDEVHGLPKGCQESIYSVIENGEIEKVFIDDVKYIEKLPPFTLIGATTEPGILSAPMRDRFSLQLALEEYSQEDMQLLVKKEVERQGFTLSPRASLFLAISSRGVPRRALSLVARCIDYAIVADEEKLSGKTCRQALDDLGIDKHGLTFEDRKLIFSLIKLFGGGPIGVETLALACDLDISTVKNVIEPYLVRLGIIERTRGGRQLGANALKFINVERKEEERE